MYPIKDKLFVIGVLNGGANPFKPINTPTIYSYVYPYLNWIDNNIGYNRCLSNGIFEFNLKNFIFYITSLIFTCSIAFTIYYFLFLVKK